MLTCVHGVTAESDSEVGRSVALQPASQPTVASITTAKWIRLFAATT